VLRTDGPSGNHQTAGAAFCLPRWRRAARVIAVIAVPLSVKIVSRLRAATANWLSANRSEVPSGLIRATIENAKRLTDNDALKLLARLPNLAVTLIDLSTPMLERAVTRIGAMTAPPITTLQGDIRSIEFEAESFDIIMAAAVFHHLRGDGEWRTMFAKCHATLKPGGLIWISDLITTDLPSIQALMWQRYGEYLTQLKGEAYRDQAYGYIEQEGTPRPLLYQLHLLKEVGFTTVEILHKTSVFAAFGGIK
jgi:tRNA (cmo5U34)-methyltransferase